jgi:hypothetical protein
VKVLDDGDDFKTLIKVTAKEGDYSITAQKEARTHGGQGASYNGESTKWQRSKDQKSGYKSGGWVTPQDGKGGKSNAMQDSPNAQSSGWWEPTEVATMPESHGGQQGKGKQRSQPAALAPWHQGKGNQQQMMMQQSGGQEMHQQGMAGQPIASWHQTQQGGMLVPKIQGAQQQGMAQASTWQGNNAMQNGQNEMCMANQAWANHMGSQQMIAETNAHESIATGKPPGAPPGIKVPFGTERGPATWLIGQWHPGGWDRNLQVTAWYLIEKNEPCLWALPDGTQRFAEHYHSDMGKNLEYRDQVMNTGQGGNIVENPWAAWNANAKGKGKNQKGNY